MAYYTELNLQICDYAQKRRICRENGKNALDHAHFCLRRKAANFCHPDVGGEDVEDEYDDITEEEFLSKVLVNDDLCRFLKKKPCVCSLVPSPSATSVAASAGVQHLVGKVLSSRPESRSPSC